MGSVVRSVTRNDHRMSIIAKEAIAKAIEGGWEPFRTVSISELECEIVGTNLHCSFRPLHNGAQGSGMCSASLYRISFDPAFWQCLCSTLPFPKPQAWQVIAHRF